MSVSKQLLVLLFVMQADLDRRENRFDVLRRRSLDQRRHGGIDMGAIGRRSRRRRGA